MISFLWHGRILGGGGPPPPGIVNPPGWSGEEFAATDYSLSGPATAFSQFVIKSDGTWETSAYGNVSGVNSGNWITPTTAGIGSSYKVRMTVTDSFGTGTAITVVNGAASVSSLASHRIFSVETTRSTSGTRIGRRTVLVEIFSLTDVLLSSASFIISAAAEVGS